MGKAPVIYAQNGTDVLLPCTFTACIGFENAKFSWTRNGTEVCGCSLLGWGGGCVGVTVLLHTLLGVAGLHSLSAAFWKVSLWGGGGSAQTSPSALGASKALPACSTGARPLGQPCRAWAVSLEEWHFWLCHQVLPGFVP